MANDRRLNGSGWGVRLERYPEWNWIRCGPPDDLAVNGTKSCAAKPYRHTRLSQISRWQRKQVTIPLKVICRNACTIETDGYLQQRLGYIGDRAGKRSAVFCRSNPINTGGERSNAP